MELDKSIGVVFLTDEGSKVAAKIKSVFPECSCYGRRSVDISPLKSADKVFHFSRLKDIMPVLWQKHDVLICIMATGIVVRTMADLICDKRSDPAVLVIDEKGKFVISLLSGHIGGANFYANYLAKKLDATPVITTASDVRNKPSLDMTAQAKGLTIENMEQMSKVMVNLLDNHPVWLYDPYQLISDELLQHYHSVKTVKSKEEVSRLDYPGIWVSDELPPDGVECLCLRPKNLVVGVGCNSGTSADEIVNFVKLVFSEENLALSSIKHFASLDIKRSEKGLKEAAIYFGRSIKFFSRNELKSLSVPNPSTTVKKYVGVDSVCEAAALKTHQRAILIVPKRKTRNVTLAIARIPYTL